MTKESQLTASEQYMKNLENKVEGLNSVVEIFEIISSTLDLKDLMSLVMEKAKGITESEACSILLYNKETNKLEFEVAICHEEISNMLMERVTIDIGQGIAGWVAQNQQPLIINDVTKDSRFYSGADKLTGFVTRNLSAYPLVGRRGLIGVVELINIHKTDYDTDLFGLLCRQFAIAIENALFHKDSIERERVRQELKIAYEVQKSFLPQSPVFRSGNIEVTAVNLPALKVGGDIYDFTEPVAGRIGILIGDVSGKGISAALYMAKILSDFRYISHTIDAPEIALNQLNSKLSSAPMGMFLTAAYMIIDVVTGKMRIAVAGHPPLILLTEKGASVLDVLAGPPLGIMPVEYAGTDMLINEGDSIIAVTDGAFEAKNKEGERLGFDRLAGFVGGQRGRPDIVRNIVGFVNDFSKGMDRADDITIVGLSRRNIQA